MFELCKYGYLPTKFLTLKTKPPPRMSCIFGKMQHQKWRGPGDILSIRKHSHDKPGKCVSTDQLVSMQPGLVPSISGRHTWDRITAATIFMDHKSEFRYSHLCTTTSQE